MPKLVAPNFKVLAAKLALLFDARQRLGYCAHFWITTAMTVAPSQVAQKVITYRQGNWLLSFMSLRLCNVLNGLVEPWPGIGVIPHTAAKVIVARLARILAHWQKAGIIGAQCYQILGWLCALWKAANWMLDFVSHC